MNIYDILIICLYIFTVFTLFSIPIFIRRNISKFNPRLYEKVIIIFFHTILSFLIWGWTSRTLESFVISFILCVYPTITLTVFTLSRLRYIDKLEILIQDLKQKQKL